MRSYDSEDQVLQALIETNIRQRGTIGGSAKKVAKRIKALEDIYGIQHGGDHGNQYKVASQNNLDLPKTQEDLARMMGVSRETLRNYKALLDMIPELEDLVDTGIVSTTTAMAIVKELSPEEQKEFLENLPEVKKLTEKKARELMAEYKETNELELRDATRKLDAVQKETRQLRDRNQQINARNTELENELEKIKNNSPEAKEMENLKTSVFNFESYCEGFITKAGGYVWLAQQIGNLPEDLKKRYKTAVSTIKDWANVLEQNIQRYE